MNRLCAALSPFPFEDLRLAHVEVYPSGYAEHCPEAVIRVRRGSPFGDSAVTLDTRNPAEAIAEWLEILGFA
jgi:hypothetical protein